MNFRLEMSSSSTHVRDFSSQMLVSRDSFIHVLP